jgi:hypothetical protein
MEQTRVMKLQMSNHHLLDKVIKIPKKSKQENITHRYKRGNLLTGEIKGVVVIRQMSVDAGCQ